MNFTSPLPPSLPGSLGARRSRSMARGAAAFVLALAGAGCNAVLGIDDASLCGGQSCDGGVPPFVSSEQRPNLPSPGQGAGSGTDDADASAPLGGGATTGGVIAPAVTPIDPGSSPSDTNGNGASSGNSGSNGSGSNGDGNEGNGNEGANPGNSGSSGEGAQGDGNGNGNGNAGEGEGDGNSGNGNGNGNAGSGGGGAGGSSGGSAEPAPTTPPPTTPPPSTPPPTTPTPVEPTPVEPTPVEPTPVPASPCDGRAAGDAFCDGVTRISCGAGSSVTSAVECPSAAHCAGGTGGACAVCLPTDVSCVGASLIACNSTQTALETTNCAGPAQCNAGLARCDAPTCAPNAVQCTGSVLEVCNATLSGFDPIADCGVPAACNIQTGSCNLCTPGAAHCIDSVTVGVCDPTGQVDIPTSCGLLEACASGECVLLGLPGLPGL